MKKTIAIGIIGIFLMTSFNSIINADEQRTSDKLITVYSFKSPVLSKVNIDNTVYDSISVDGAPCGGNPGEPLLPGKCSYVLLPANSKVGNIIVNLGERICLGSGYLVEPAGEPVPLSDIDNAPIPVPNEEIYSSTDLFPGTFYSEVGTYRCKGYDILVLKLNPVQYIPKTGELFYYPSLTVNVETIDEIKDNVLLRGLEKDNLDIASKIDNPTALESFAIYGQRQSSPLDLYDMVIITSDSLKSGFEPLALAHNSTGIRTFIKTVEDIVSDSDYWVSGEWGDANPDNPFIETPITNDISRFNDTAAKIRNFIRDAYTNFGIDYVLLGADHDVIPAKFLSANIEDWNTNRNVPSDFYYSGLDGTWNRPMTSYPENKDISINDTNVIGSGGGFLGIPVENYTDFLVGDSSMQWTCTNTNYEYGFCNLTFSTPIDLSGNRWVNFYIKNIGGKYTFNGIILHSTDGSEINYTIYRNQGSKWGIRHIEIPDYYVFNWQSVDSISFKIGYYNELKIGDSVLLDGIYFSDFVDDYWGEPGDDDLFAEIYVGRACTDNIIEVNNFVDKTIKYISTDSNDYYLKKVLMIGERWGYGGEASWGGYAMNELIDGSSKHGYTTVGIPSSDYRIRKLYEGPGPLGFIRYLFPYEIILKINNNFHIINHAGHSGYDHNMKLYNSDVDNLTNDKFNFIYSQGCFAGGFDNPDGYDCIAEHFTVKTTHGAFAGIWNTREGILIWNSTDDASHRHHREFWDAIFGEGIYEIGKANQDSKEDNIWRINEWAMRFVYYELTLFGDPTIDLVNHYGNTGPDKPDTPDGPTEGEAGVEYSYTTCTIDLDGHYVKYGWDWQGDFIVDEWTDFYPSGTPVTTSHSWPLPGPRWIRVRAIDIFGSKSEWSDPLQISLPVVYENSQVQSQQSTPQSQPSEQLIDSSTQQYTIGSTTTTK